jgi:hypothetical protein
MKRLVPLVVVISQLLMGCTDSQLRKNVVRQSLSVTEIAEQQVLDNLAMFVCSPNSLPSFAFPNQAGLFVTDTGNFGLTPTWQRFAQSSSPLNGLFLFNSLGLSLTGQRQAQDAFTLTPINDPRKLELMRCAYQRAVASCGIGTVSQKCPDCQPIFNKFYTGDPNGDILDHAHGTTTSECLKDRPCWFQYGSKKCVPKKCARVGHYCDVYVWVGPEGEDDLTKLTLMILDYAFNSPPVSLSKQVVYYIDEYGIPTQQKLAVGQVTATVAIDENNVSLLNTSTQDEVRIQQVVKSRLKKVRQTLTELADKITKEEKAAPKTADEKGAGAPKNDPHFEQYKQLLDEELTLENKLEYLNEQLRTPGLRQRFYPVGPAPTTTPLLDLNLFQSTLGRPAFSSP